MRESFRDVMDKEYIYINKFIHGSTGFHRCDFLKIVYVVENSAIFVRNGVQREVCAGDYFIVDYNSYHMYESDKPISLINCLFLPEFIDNTLKGCNSVAAVLNNYLIRFECGIRESIDVVFRDDDGNIKRLLDKMMNEFREKRPGYLELMRCTLIEIIIYMMRHTAAQSHTSYRNHSKYIMDYVNKNYNKDISLSAIAEDLHYTVSHLSHTFSEDTGMGFNAYLQKVRLEHACRLLANTDKKIFEIAEAVGIYDTDYFRELFKRHFDISPAAFRKNFK